MKRILAILLMSISFLSMGIINPYALAKDKNSGNMVTLYMSDTVNPATLKAHGFDTVILKIPAIRNPKAPYNTNYAKLKLLYENILKLKSHKLKYYISFTSGPGFSSEDKLYTLFKNELELKYFAQMTGEIIKRYQNDEYFVGVSIDLEAPDIIQQDYYRVQNYIVSKIRMVSPDISIIYNLHPLTYENNYKYLPDFKDRSLLYNLNLKLTALNYPGFGTAFKTSYPISKNSLLTSFEKFKDFTNSNKLNSIISCTLPWVKNSEVMLQDSYEIFKMLNLKINLCYWGSRNQFDISLNKSVLKIIDRHNK